MYIQENDSPETVAKVETVGATARAAAPHIRRILRHAPRDGTRATVTTITPSPVRPFVTAYCRDRGIAVSFVTGDTTRKTYTTVGLLEPGDSAA